MSRARLEVWRRALLLLTATAVFLGQGCATPSVEQERERGAQMRAQERQALPLLSDPVVNRYVDAIGQKIVAAAGPQPFHYHFGVVNSKEINAFAGWGGNVYVNTGLILKARNVSELAGVLGHEIGHVVKRHVAANYGRLQGINIARQAGVLAAGLALGQVGAVSANVVGSLSGLALVNSFGREAEREADDFAVQVLPKAGYDPEGTVSFFQTLLSEGDAGATSFLSNHPATQERIARARAAVAALPHRDNLRVNDDGRLEIIQRRIRLLTGAVETPAPDQSPVPLGKENAL